MSSPVEFDARTTGRFARRALLGGRRAIVIALFARSIYVETAAGLACIGGAELGPGPLNVAVDAAGPLPPPGAAVRVRFASAHTWKPVAPPAVARPALVRGLASLRDVRGRGLFARREADPAIAVLGRWIAENPGRRVPRACAVLIGRGPGLTPAGDDLVGGALVALRALRRHARAIRLGRWALRQARHGTSRISRAHLACAASGEGSAALHALIAALLSGTRDASRELAAIDETGHTSGWDAAAGALLVLQCATGGAGVDRTSRSR